MDLTEQVEVLLLVQLEHKASKREVQKLKGLRQLSVLEEQPQKEDPSRYYIKDNALVRSPTKPSRFYVDSAASSRGRGRISGRGRAGGPSGQFSIKESAYNQPQSIPSNSRFYVDTSQEYSSKFEIDVNRLKGEQQAATGSSNSLVEDKRQTTA